MLISSTNLFSRFHTHVSNYLCNIFIQKSETCKTLNISLKLNSRFTSPKYTPFHNLLHQISERQLRSICFWGAKFGVILDSSFLPFTLKFCWLCFQIVDRIVTIFFNHFYLYYSRLSSHLEYSKKILTSLPVYFLCRSQNDSSKAQDRWSLPKADTPTTNIFTLIHHSCHYGNPKSLIQF